MPQGELRPNKLLALSISVPIPMLLHLITTRIRGQCYYKFQQPVPLLIQNQRAAPLFSDCIIGKHCCANVTDFIRTKCQSNNSYNW